MSKMNLFPHICVFPVTGVAEGAFLRLRRCGDLWEIWCFGDGFATDEDDSASYS